MITLFFKIFILISIFAVGLVLCMLSLFGLDILRNYINDNTKLPEWLTVTLYIISSLVVGALTLTLLSYVLLKFSFI